VPNTQASSTAPNANRHQRTWLTSSRLKSLLHYSDIRDARNS
jgi:hypothetical protein